MGKLKKILNQMIMIYQNLWDIAKAVLRGKYIALGAYLEKNSKINKPSTNLAQDFSENRTGRNTGQLIS